MLRMVIATLFIVICFSVAGAQVRTGTVTTTKANLRDTPSQAGEVKQEVPIGTEIKILDRKGPWYVVRIADALGWMHGNTFRFADGRSEETTNTPQQPLAPAMPPRITTPDPIPSTTSSTTVTTDGLIRGPRGGCYHYSKSGKKVYVDRSRCN